VPRLADIDGHAADDGDPSMRGLPPGTEKRPWSRTSTPINRR
jgi:hypothetical protein